MSPKRYERRRGLSALQWEAIPLELEGKTAVEIGNAIGVSPGTIRNWRSADVLYQATINKLRNERVRARIGRLEELEDLSLDAMRDEIRSGNGFIALRYHTAYSKSPLSLAPEDEPSLVRELARHQMIEAVTDRYESIDVEAAVRAFEERIEERSVGWEILAGEALDAVGELEEAVEEDKIDLDKVVEMTASSLSCFSEVLVKSEGEGLRASREPSEYQGTLPEILSKSMSELNFALVKYRFDRRVGKGVVTEFAQVVGNALRRILDSLFSGHPSDEACLGGRVAETDQVVRALEAHIEKRLETRNEADAGAEEQTCQMMAQAVGATAALPYLAIGDERQGRP